jgi:hypothetical protein
MGQRRADDHLLGQRRTRLRGLSAKVRWEARRRVTTPLPLIEALAPRCIAMGGVCVGRRGKVELGENDRAHVQPAPPFA